MKTPKEKFDAQLDSAKAAISLCALALEERGIGPAVSVMALAEMAGTGILAFPQAKREALMLAACTRLKNKAGQGAPDAVNGVVLE